MRYPTLSLTRGLLLTIFLLALLGCVTSWAQTEKTLLDFDSTDGSNPTAGLAFDRSGNLYGTTIRGGNGRPCGLGCGVVFQLTPNADGTWSETVVHNFTGGDDGANPSAPVIVDPSGNLYGTTSAGGAYSYGNAFKMSPSSGEIWTESVIHAFTGGWDGCSPYEEPEGALTLDNGGHLYGAAWCGVNEHGVIFSLAHVAVPNWYELVLDSFPGDGEKGFSPNGSLIFDAHGSLYGTTPGGGRYEDGTVFKLTPNGVTPGWRETVLYAFQGGEYGPDGSTPFAGVVFDSKGNLYGTTFRGGGSCDPYGTPCGVVFRLTPQPDGTWSESVIHAFQGYPTDGSQPWSPVVADAAGNVYGTTYQGGKYGYGTVYKLTPSSNGQWTETILWSFTRNADGANPVGGLVLDNAGNLYGTTENGGNFSGIDLGTVFEIIP